MEQFVIVNAFYFKYPELRNEEFNINLLSANKDKAKSGQETVVLSLPEKVEAQAGELVNNDGAVEIVQDAEVVEETPKHTGEKVAASINAILFWVINWVPVIFAYNKTNGWCIGEPDSLTEPAGVITAFIFIMFVFVLRYSFEEGERIGCAIHNKPLYFMKFSFLNILVAVIITPLTYIISFLLGYIVSLGVTLVIGFAMLAVGVVAGIFILPFS